MENISSFLFYIIFLVIVIFATFSIFSNRIIYSVLSAVVVFISVGALYFLLNASFNAVAQIAVYGVGASLLLIFAVMFSSYNKEKELYLNFTPRTFIAGLGLVLVIVSFVFLFIQEFKKSLYGLLKVTKETSAQFFFGDTLKGIGERLFMDYQLAFEILALFLLIAIVGVGIICFKSVNGGKGD